MYKPLTMAELKKAITKIKKKKLPGPGGNTDEMIMNLGIIALYTLLEIFNLSWKDGEVPQI